MLKCAVNCDKNHAKYSTIKCLVSDLQRYKSMERDSGSIKVNQGGRCCGTVVTAVLERSGSSPKGRTLEIRYFVTKLRFVAIYALYE